MTDPPRDITTGASSTVISTGVAISGAYALKAVQLFNMNTSTWTETAQVMSQGRSWHSSITLSNGISYSKDALYFQGVF
jgi:hypothetical protein